jgi:hypothetical protein
MSCILLLAKTARGATATPTQENLSTVSWSVSRQENMKQARLVTLCWRWKINALRSQNTVPPPHTNKNCFKGFQDLQQFVSFLEDLRVNVRVKKGKTVSRGTELFLDYGEAQLWFDARSSDDEPVVEETQASKQHYNQ